MSDDSIGFDSAGVAKILSSFPDKVMKTKDQILYEEGVADIAQSDA